MDERLWVSRRAREEDQAKSQDKSVRAFITCIIHVDRATIPVVPKLVSHLSAQCLALCACVNVQAVILSITRRT
jgi:hypothetical protein